MQELLGNIDKFIILIVVMILWVYINVKIILILCFKYVQLLNTNYTLIKLLQVFVSFLFCILKTKDLNYLQLHCCAKSLFLLI